MTSVLIEREEDTDTQRRKRVKTEAEMGVMKPQGKGTSGAT